MKKLLMAAAAITLMMTMTMLTSCTSEDDSPITSPEPEQLADYTILFYGNGGASLDEEILENLTQFYQGKTESYEHMNIVAQYKFSTEECLREFKYSTPEADKNYGSQSIRFVVEHDADKTYKNHLASTLLYESFRGMKTSGIIEEDPANGILKIAEPVGLVMGIVPSTNPTSTAIFKAMIAVKARNAIIFSPHPSAAKCTLRAAQLMADAAVQAGAPANTIACVSMPTMQATDELMHHKNVKVIIATGGPGMVKAAYSAGKPALGVGAGNSPAYIERTANVQKAVTNIPMMTFPLTPRFPRMTMMRKPTNARMAGTTLRSSPLAMAPWMSTS